MGKQISMHSELHDFSKKNLITNSDNTDTWKCNNCGIEGKRRGLTDMIEIDGRASEDKINNCDGKDRSTVDRIRIKSGTMVPKSHAENLTDGSEHLTVQPDEPEDRNLPGRWVIGSQGKPVRLFPHEYEIIEKDIKPKKKKMKSIKLPAKKTKKKKSKKSKPKTESTEVAVNYVDEIKNKYASFKKMLKKVDDVQQDAFDRMFEFGEQLLLKEDQVKEEYGTWSKFCSDTGIDQSTLSRCKASVADFKMHGADDLQSARKLLKSRGHKPTAKMMEYNINRMLTDSEKASKKKSPKDKSVKSQKHVEELHRSLERVNEIVEQHEPDDDIYGEAVHTAEFIEDSINHLKSLDISQKQWNSQLYLDFCRNVNYDVVLGEPVEASEPMHISPNGDMGSMGGKVADFYAIPGCRDTHNKLDSGKIDFDEDDIAHWHRETMARFLFHTIASDKTPKDIDNIPETEFEEK